MICIKVYLAIRWPDRHWRQYGVHHLVGCGRNILNGLYNSLIIRLPNLKGTMRLIITGSPSVAAILYFVRSDPAGGAKFSACPCGARLASV